MCAAVRLRDGMIGVGVLTVATIAAAVATRRLNPIALFVTVLAGYRFAGAWWRSRRTRRSGTALERLTQLAVDAAAPQGSVTDQQHRAAALVTFGLAAALIVTTHVLALHLPRVAL